MEAPEENARPLSAPSRRRDVAAIALLVCLVFATFRPVLGAEFGYWDDEQTIRLNPRFDPPTWQSLIDHWAAPHLNIYVPLTHTLWHGLALLGPRPTAGEIGFVVAWPFKWASVCVHAMTAVAVFVLARRMFGRAGPASIVASFVALTFALHPLQVESVAWTSGMKDLLFGLFGALALLAYVGGDADRVRPRGRNIGLALACLTCAGLSKPTAMVLPAMMLAADAIWMRRPLAQSLTRLVPFAAVAVAFALAARAMQPGDQPIGIAATAIARRPMLAADSLAFYVGKVLWPTGLAFDYGRTPAVVLAQSLAAFAARVLIAAAPIGAAFALRRRAPLVALGAAWFLLPLAPTLGLVSFDFSYFSIVADHYAYLAMLGVAVALGGMAARLEGRHGRRAFAPVAATWAVVLVSYAFASYRQASTWLTPTRTSLRTLAINPHSFGSWANLAVAELRAGDVDAAAAHADRAAREAPGDAAVQSVIGQILLARRDLPGVTEHLRRAIAGDRRNAAYRLQLAGLLEDAGRYDEAAEWFDEAARIDPTDRVARERAGRARARATATTTAATRQTKPATR